MSLLKIAAVFVAIALMAIWLHKRGGTDYSTVSPQGFVRVAMPIGAMPNVVYIFASGCSCREESLPAYEMVEQLKIDKIPNEWIESYSTEADDGLDVVEHNSMVARTNEVLAGLRPIAFINGRGKANPTVAEVEAEFKSSKLKNP